MLRPSIWQFIWSKVGDGLSTSAWYDNCSGIGTLDTIITPRDGRNAGFSILR